MSQTTPQAQVVAVQEDLVTLALADPGRGTLMKNEVVYICPDPDTRLEAEVLRVRGDRADAQVFESTKGVGIGDPVLQSGELLSVALGPGLLGQVFDGLQNPLTALAVHHGTFLPRGVDMASLDRQRKWSFVPVVQVGAKLRAGDVVGTVQEGPFSHKVMVPFGHRGTAEITWIQQAAVTVDTPVARWRDAKGEHSMTLVQRWPVRRPLAEHLLRERFSERRYPTAPLITTQRIIDTFFPIAQGGTACIPGPFGAGKTVLQNLIARFAAVDIVVIVACGERAGEVVETITEFPKLKDPKGTGSLMDRTVLICNTSSMPVAAREASLYTGITLGEYYRQMGLQVLLIADSTSRWAQAMRETSGRLEEIPGEEAFPAYLDSAIRSVYERAGVVACNDGARGSLTLIGTVSPAGGNFEEPVTQSTLGTVKTFLGLSAERAYKRYYPAVDPLTSWSRYFDQLEDWYREHCGPTWVAQVQTLLALLHQGEEIQQMMQVTGEEGITLADFVRQQKALLLDLAYLQQDAFDPVDASANLERQRQVLDLILHVVNKPFAFADKDSARRFFTQLTGAFKNFHYTVVDSPDHRQGLEQIRQLIDNAPAQGESLETPEGGSTPNT
ncbi:MAG: V-type ATP synthase subunit A [Candidatus Competibacterales bacterium]